jgi:hypothetical protein
MKGKNKEKMTSKPIVYESHVRVPIMSQERMQILRAELAALRTACGGDLRVTNLWMRVDTEDPILQRYPGTFSAVVHITSHRRKTTDRCKAALSAKVKEIYDLIIELAG